MSALNIAILGATGVVGQKAIALIGKMNGFKIRELVASDQRVGQRYGDCVDWREPLSGLPQDVGNIKLESADRIESDYVISCLPQDVAKSVEPMLAEKGKMVFSNASAFRMKPMVPLIVPEINRNHLSLLASQTTTGKIVTNPNCSTVGVTLALAPLLKTHSIEHVSVVTLQSVSGAGFPGISSMDALGNTIPHIEGEAEKINEETKKILGTPTEPASFFVTASVHRVPVLFGHTATLHLTMRDHVHVEDVVACYDAWNRAYPGLFVLHAGQGRPQPLKDLVHDDMRVHLSLPKIGDQPNILKMTVLSHNLVRGAAGAAIGNMLAYLKFIGE